MKEPQKRPPGRYEISLSRIKDLPGHRRPRELAQEVGVSHAPDEVLLAILLRAGIPGQSVIDLARQVLDRHQGTLGQLAKATHDELRAIKGIGPVFAKRLNEAGIVTFADVAAASADQLREVTHATAVANPEEWIAEARSMKM